MGDADWLKNPGDKSMRLETKGLLLHSARARHRTGSKDVGNTGLVMHEPERNIQLRT